MKDYQEGIEDAGRKFLADETQYADAVADKAVVAMEAIMQKYPDGIAIICANNDDMAMAAARTSKDNGASKNTIFLGFDGNNAACESILAGEETMSVTQNAYGMGYQSVEAAINYLNDGEQPKFIEAETGVVDKSNAQERLGLLKSYIG